MWSRLDAAAGPINLVLTGVPVHPAEPVALLRTPLDNAIRDGSAAPVDVVPDATDGPHGPVTTGGLVLAPLVHIKRQYAAARAAAASR